MNEQKFKIIAKVPNDTLAYKNGMKLMACIVTGEEKNGIVIPNKFIESIEFFETREEAKEFVSKNPNYRFRNNYNSIC